MACVGWPILKVEDCHMAASECIYFMSEKRGANRQGPGCKSRFCETHLERGECISNVWGTKVIFPEFADFSLI